MMGMATDGHVLIITRYQSSIGTRLKKGGCFVVISAALLFHQRWWTEPRHLAWLLQSRERLLTVHTQRPRSFYPLAPRFVA